MLDQRMAENSYILVHDHFLSFSPVVSIKFYHKATGRENLYLLFLLWYDMLTNMLRKEPDLYEPVFIDRPII